VNRVGLVLPILLAVSCVTQTVPPKLEKPLIETASPPVLHSTDPRTTPDSPYYRPIKAVWTLVSTPDLEHWPWGWVESDDSPTGLPSRFWSERRAQWREALSAAPSQAAFRLERLYHEAHGDEAFRAAWLLWQVYSHAGLGEQARVWLDRAADLRHEPSLELERAWDQAYRLHDLWGARSLWAELGPVPADERKYRLLRQKLFLGTRSLVPLGADDYVSSVELDRDDLWAATWDGAVIRWSLVTGDADLIRAAGDTVSPIRCLAVTGWFIYAFQDKALLRYSKVAGTWRTFPYPAGWNGLRIQGAVVEGQETLLVGHLGEGLWRWDRGQWSLVDAGGGGPFINAIASDGQGGLWVGTKDRGLWSWSGGVWSEVPSENGSPTNISVIEPSPDQTSWAVGSWGEGAWVLHSGILSRASGNGTEYITAATWTDRPVWGTLDQGIYSVNRVLGPLDGVPVGVSALVAWQGRWIWGTSGQGLGWWSEDENTALSR
jgi:hypothetical protein